MELEEAIESLENLKILFEIEDERDFEATPKQQRIIAQKIAVVLNHLTKQEKMIKKIHENFCKFDWKNSNGEQVHNQLKELYESIFINEESE